MLETERARQADRLLRLIGRYRSLLADARDGLLRRGIEREIDLLKAKLKRLESQRVHIPCLIARGVTRRDDP